MKLLFKLFAGLILCSVFAGSARAQPRLATIDLGRVFTNYWKTQDINADLQKQQADISKQLKEMMDEYTKMKEDYQKLLDSSTDQTISAEERDKRKTAALKKLQDIREQENAIRGTDSSKKEEMGMKQQRLRANIMAEIRTVLVAQAKSAGYTLVFDTAAMSAQLTPIVVYSSGENDLTDAVMKELNKLAPPDYPKPADTADEKKAEPGKTLKK